MNTACLIMGILCLAAAIGLLALYIYDKHKQ